MNFYSAYRVLGPASRFAFRVAGLFDKKIAKGLELRRETAGRPAWMTERALERPVWIHCSSGEFEYAKPVVTRLKAKNIPVLVTYFSPTYVEAIRNFAGVSAVVPLPWDTESDVSAFLDFHKPRALLVSRTDVWPEMARVARDRNLPAMLFSATLTPESGRARGLGRWMAHAALSQLRAIWCVTTNDRDVFASLGLNAEVHGDTRYDQVRARLAQPRPIREELFTPDPRPIFVAGSTWDEDEAVLLEVAKTLEKEIRFVFVPHEPTDEHVRSLESRLAAKGVKSSRYSSASSWTEGVLIVDKTGILAELYLKGRFGFVGGSFRKTVHSVMEPLAAGCLTFVGPLHLNNREALELKSVASEGGLRCVEAVSSADEMVSRLKLALSVDAAKLASKIRSEIEARGGASDQVVQWTLTVSS